MHPSDITTNSTSGHNGPLDGVENEADSHVEPTHMDRAKIEEAVIMILEAIGEDPKREGLLETPARVARMYEEIFAGLHMDPASVLSARFNVDHEEVVFVKDITFYSMCEHHLLPFFGKAHIAYLPGKGIVTGLSKLARLVEAVAKRPQVQERMTNEIAEILYRELDAQGVMVIIEAEHLCMNMRGVKKPGSQTITMATRGKYSEDSRQCEQVFRLLRN